MLLNIFQLAIVNFRSILCIMLNIEDNGSFRFPAFFSTLLYWRCKKFVDDDEGAKVSFVLCCVFSRLVQRPRKKKLFLFSGKVRFIVWEEWEHKWENLCVMCISMLYHLCLSSSHRNTVSNESFLCFSLFSYIIRNIRYCTCWNMSKRILWGVKKTGLKTWSFYRKKCAVAFW